MRQNKFKRTNNRAKATAAKVTSVSKPWLKSQEQSEKTFKVKKAKKQFFNKNQKGE